MKSYILWSWRYNLERCMWKIKGVSRRCFVTRTSSGWGWASKIQRLRGSRRVTQPARFQGSPRFCEAAHGIKSRIWSHRRNHLRGWPRVGKLILYKATSITFPEHRVILSPWIPHGKPHGINLIFTPNAVPGRNHLIAALMSRIFIPTV